MCHIIYFGVSSTTISVCACVAISLINVFVTDVITGGIVTEVKFITIGHLANM